MSGGGTIETSSEASANASAKNIPQSQYDSLTGRNSAKSSELSKMTTTPPLNIPI